MVKKVAYEALDKYFSLVSERGYIPYGRVAKIMFLLMADEFIDRFMEFMDEGAVRSFQRLFGELFGSDCFISLPVRANSIGFSGGSASGSLCARRRKNVRKDKPRHVDGILGDLENVLKPYKGEEEDEQL